MAELGTMLRPIRQCLHLRIPAANGAAQARVRALGQIDEERYEDEWVYLRARIPAHAEAEFSEFLQETK